MYESDFLKQLEESRKKVMSRKATASGVKITDADEIDQLYGPGVIGKVNRTKAKTTMVWYDNGDIKIFKNGTNTLHSVYYPAIIERGDRNRVQFFIDGQPISMVDWSKKTGRKWTKENRDEIKRLREKAKVTAKPKNVAGKLKRYTPPPKIVKK